MEYVLIGIVSAFNLLIIKFKVDRKRYEDAFFDAGLMVVLAYLFAGSYGGMVVAMVASLVISIFLFISPPKFTNKANTFLREQWKEFNDEFGTPNPPKKEKGFNL